MKNLEKLSSTKFNPEKLTRYAKHEVQGNKQQKIRSLMKFRKV